MKIFLLAPNYCWHTQDLLKLTKYSKRLDYIFVADTPIFISRGFYKKYFNFLNVSYEFIQRIWRLIFCLPWGIYLKIRLSGQIPIHCHGLFSLFVAHIAGISNSRIIFTPQGSDLLILPDKNSIVRKFLLHKLARIAFITADSNLLLEKALVLSPSLKKNKLKIIQNGIPLADIDKLIKKRENFKKRNIDICWIRGVSNVYQFEYFLKLLKKLSNFSTSKINVCIISAYGRMTLPKQIYDYENINIKLLPRLNSEDFLSTLYNSKIVISIPKSDSSPRSVYEALILGCTIFVTNLECFNWISSKLKSKFIYCSYDLKKDSLKLIHEIENFKSNDFNTSMKEKYNNFRNALDYEKIANKYLKIFEKVQNS